MQTNKQTVTREATSKLVFSPDGYSQKMLWLRYACQKARGAIDAYAVIQSWMQT